MEAVTQLAVLIASLEGVAAPEDLRDIARVAMLHDVADHKYDLDGTLEPRVRAFIAAELYPGDAEGAAMAWASIDAVSYSKENKRGMRYFAATLGPRWTRVRDIVSDADKLLAIGEDGLERCWHYQLELRDGAIARATAARAAAGSDADAPDMAIPAPITPEELVADVVQHAHDKLLRLSTEFMVTPSGKFLAAPKHRDMEAVLEAWKVAPPTTRTYQGLC
jgi:HD superfamily phosphodiesterase